MLMAGESRPPSGDACRGSERANRKGCVCVLGSWFVCPPWQTRYKDMVYVIYVGGNPSAHWWEGSE